MHARARTHARTHTHICTLRLDRSGSGHVTIEKLKKILWVEETQTPLTDVSS